jgi:hypothetical protein
LLSFKSKEDDQGYQHFTHRPPAKGKTDNMLQVILGNDVEVNFQ